MMPCAEKKKVVAIFSYHLYAQRRRGSMHWICDSLRKAGWHVRFITCDYSTITRLKGDRRTAYGECVGVNRLHRVDDSLSVGVVSTPWHPVGNRASITGRLASSLTSSYPWPRKGVVRDFAGGANLVIVESCGGLLMLDEIRRATPSPIIYRVSDNLRVVRPVPALLAAEARAVSSVTAVSLASRHLASALKVGANARFDPMGVDKRQFDEATSSPYPEDGRVKVVISGSSGLDYESLRLAAESHPDWDFVQFGSTSNLPRSPNILDMGERPFSELVPWVKFADIGFAPYVNKPGFEYQAEHSNRLLQYVYSGLPCVVPQELVASDKPHFIGYRAGDAPSIRAALDAARDMDRELVPAQSVLDWDQLAARLAGVAGEKRACA